jgi:NAD dependent epimerase/dehydratase family enzyme
LTRALLGEFSSALTDDQRVVPAKALAAGFAYRHAEGKVWLQEALPARVAGEDCQPWVVRAK